MDMYQKRKLRAKKKQEDSNNDKSCTSVNINWFKSQGQFSNSLTKIIFTTFIFVKFF